jgi:hypothetical protein
MPDIQCPSCGGNNLLTMLWATVVRDGRLELTINPLAKQPIECGDCLAEFTAQLGAERPWIN